MTAPTRIRPARRRSSAGSRGLVLVLIGAMVIAAVAWVVFFTGTLGVREVVVTGTRLLTVEQVRAAAAVAVDTPLLRVDTSEVAGRVRALPPVADVQVRRSLPHTLTIAITERSPVAVVAEPGGFAVLDEHGVIFDHVATPPAGTAPIRVSAPGPDDPATLAALRVLDALTPPLRALLAEVVAPSPTHITLALTDGRTVVWGDANDSELKASVATTLLDHAPHVIDVTVPSVATVS